MAKKICLSALAALVQLNIVAHDGGDGRAVVRCRAAASVEIMGVSDRRRGLGPRFDSAEHSDSADHRLELGKRQ